MKEGKQWLIVTFATTTQALALETAASEDGIPGRIIPLPQQISAGCGLAWKCETAVKDALVGWLTGRGLRWESMYELLL